MKKPVALKSADVGQNVSESEKITAMRKMEELGRKFLFASPFYAPIRDGYQRVFAPNKLAARNGMKLLYSSFVHRDDLVFDIGANIGEYAELFAELGAIVVAVEPNPVTCETLAQMARARNVRIEQVAVGDVPGQLELHICADNSTISTVSETWFETAQQSPFHAKNRWLEPIKVNVMTIDQLAEKYGRPAFIKIDVEGFDDHVLRGMSFRPPVLSFEFNREIPQIALNCLETPALAEGYEFNYIVGMEMRMASSFWLSAADLRERIFNEKKSYGDVFARRL
jgi:FkbM family methyltransferase